MNRVKTKCEVNSNFYAKRSIKLVVQFPATYCC